MEINEVPQQVEVVAATVRGTPVVFCPSTTMLRRSEACNANQGQHFLHFLQKGGSILSCFFFLF